MKNKETILIEGYSLEQVRDLFRNLLMSQDYLIWATGSLVKNNTYSRDSEEFRLGFGQLKTSYESLRDVAKDYPSLLLYENGKYPLTTKYFEDLIRNLEEKVKNE